MIDPAGIPQIAGDMGALTGHAGELSQVGTAFADTGARIHGGWQALAPHYLAPEADQLFAATTSIPPITASVGEDLRTVGSALSTYAAEVTGIQTRLRALQSQAGDFVAFAAANPDWRDNEADVQRHADLLGAVNAEVAAFQDAERRCANAILALYSDQRYVVDNGDGVLDPGEHGFTREALDAALAQEGGLPWGSPEAYDRGFFGDVGAFFAGFGEAAGDAAVGLAALVGYADGGFSWETAGTAWAGLGMFALSLTPVRDLNRHVDLPFLAKGTLDAVLEGAVKEFTAHDTWGQDPARAAGKVTFNFVSAILGTKGAGAALRGGGGVAAASEVAVVARAGAGVVRVGDAIGRLPSVSDLASGALSRFRGIDIPPIDLPDIDLPPSHVDTPRVEVDPPRVDGPTIGDAVSPGGVEPPRGAPEATAPGTPDGPGPGGGGSTPGGGGDPRPEGPAAADPATSGAPPDAGRPDPSANGGDGARPPSDAGTGADGEGRGPADPAPSAAAGAPPEGAPGGQPVGTAVAAADAPPPPDGGRPSGDAETTRPEPDASAPVREPVAAGQVAAEAPTVRPEGAGGGAGHFDLDAPGDRAPDGPVAPDGTPGRAGADGPDAGRPVGPVAEAGRPGGTGPDGPFGDVPTRGGADAPLPDGPRGADGPTGRGPDGPDGARPGDGARTDAPDGGGDRGSGASGAGDAGDGRGDSNGGDSNGGDSNGGDSNGGDPNGGDSNGGDPNGGDPGDGGTGAGDGDGVPGDGAPGRAHGALPPDRIPPPVIRETPLETRALDRQFEREDDPTYGGRFFYPDTVQYFDEARLESARVVVVDGRLHWAESGKLLDTADGTSLHHKGQPRAIFVQDEHGNLYVELKQVKGEKHHSSFLGGRPVANAGELQVVNGVPTMMSRASGHYLPTSVHQNNGAAALAEQGLDISQMRFEGF